MNNNSDFGKYKCRFCKILSKSPFKIALSTNLTQSLQDIELKYDTVTDKPMYRERGADTWLPFSGGGYYANNTWASGQSFTVDVGFTPKKIMCITQVSKSATVNPLNFGVTSCMFLYDEDTSLLKRYQGDAQSSIQSAGITISGTNVTFDTTWSQYNNGGQYWLLAC